MATVRKRGRAGGNQVVLKATGAPAVPPAEAAADFVQVMRKAAKADEEARAKGLPALTRLGIVPRFVLATSRVSLHEHLIEAGFLKEVASWIADTKRKELAPLDLRTVALDALERFAIEGVSCGKLPAKVGTHRKVAGADVLLDESTYDGITVEQLEAAPELGRALNFARNASGENADFKRRVSSIIENVSRAFHDVGGGSKVDRAGGATVKWKAYGDPTVLPPFEILKTKAEICQGVFCRVDPLDPTSYSRVPPTRTPPAYITGLFLGKNGRDREDALRDNDADD